MANIRNIVKVMNFHSLVRVDKAKKNSEKYFIIENELKDFIYKIIYNKNLNLDKKSYMPNQDGFILNIYIGNDLGFCGNFNSQLTSTMKMDSDSKKIVIGKKIIRKTDDVILNITKEEFYRDFSKIEEIIYKNIFSNKIKEINVLYNKYYTVNDIRFEKVRLFPIDSNGDSNLKVDYVIETDINELIANLLALYLCYEIKIIESNSWASENVMRQTITKESLKKLDEIEEDKTRRIRKEKNSESFKRQINNYILKR